jgi:uncharacterized protein (DUF952 family)
LRAGGPEAGATISVSLPPLLRTTVTHIYKIVASDEWRPAETAGTFAGAAVDRADGYIHFSTVAQAPETAARWFAGQRDLTLVAVDAEAVGPDLRWEPSRGGALFPHLYAPLRMSAVRWSRPLPLGSDGRHDFGGLGG